MDNKNDIPKKEPGDILGRHRKIIESLSKSAVKPGVDLASIVEILRKRREKKIHGEKNDGTNAR